MVNFCKCLLHSFIWLQIFLPIFHLLVPAGQRFGRRGVVYLSHFFLVRAVQENAVAVVTAGWIGDRCTVTLPDPQTQSCNLWNRGGRSRSGNVRRLLNSSLWWEENALQTKGRNKTPAQVHKIPSMRATNGSCSCLDLGCDDESLPSSWSDRRCVEVVRWLCARSSNGLVLGRNTKYMKEKDICNIKSCNKSPLVLQDPRRILRAVWSKLYQDGCWIRRKKQGSRSSPCHL